MPSIPATLQKHVNEAIHRLVSAEHFQIGSIVSMPVLYPSGASVVLEVLAQKDNVFITDRGGGYQEAEFGGDTTIFVREAAKVAAEAGIRFAGHDMFAVEVPLDRLPGAMTVVASCSMQAASIAVMAGAARHQNRAKEVLFEKLDRVFGEKGFERNVQLLGASNHSWRVDALVRRPNSLTVFDAVVPKHVAVTGAVTKFFDLSRVERPPKRIAVVSNKLDMGDWYGVISAAADEVVDVRSEDAEFHRLPLAVA